MINNKKFMSARHKVNIRKFPEHERGCECESGSEEKITRVIALALTLALFSVPGAGLEPAQP